MVSSKLQLTQVLATWLQTRPQAWRDSVQGSRHSDLVFVGLFGVFDGVSQDQFGAWGAGLTGCEVRTQLGDGFAGPGGGERVQPDGQVAGCGGVDVAAAF